MALTLARRTGESIVIDGRITVTVSTIGLNKVRLTVDAPREVSIDRREVLLSKRITLESSHVSTESL